MVYWVFLEEIQRKGGKERKRWREKDREIFLEFSYKEELKLYLSIEDWLERIEFWSGLLCFEEVFDY